MVNISKQWQIIIKSCVLDDWILKKMTVKSGHLNDMSYTHLITTAEVTEYSSRLAGDSLGVKGQQHFTNRSDE